MSLNPERWTLKTQEAFTAATELAKARNNPEVTIDHLLAALLGQQDGVVLPILQRVGVNPLSLRNQVDDAIGRLPRAYGSEVRVARELRDLLEVGDAARNELSDEYLSTEHLLMALADRIKVPREQLLAALREVRGSHHAPRNDASRRRDLRAVFARGGRARERCGRRRGRCGDVPIGYVNKKDPWID